MDQAERRQDAKAKRPGPSGLLEGVCDHHGGQQGSSRPGPPHATPGSHWAAGSRGFILRPQGVAGLGGREGQGQDRTLFLFLFILFFKFKYQLKPEENNNSNVMKNHRGQ